MSFSAKILILILTIVIGIFYGGFVTSVLWGWYMVPLGVIPINYLQAVGVGCVINCFLGLRGIDAKKDNGDEGVMLGVVAALFVPTWCLFIGWLVY